MTLNERNTCQKLPNHPVDTDQQTPDMSEACEA